MEGADGRWEDGVSYKCFVTDSNDRGLCIVAVEAKVNGDFDTLLKYRRVETTTSQHDRLTYLSELLRVRKLNDTIRYQLPHRIASAILAVQEFHAPYTPLVV